MCRKFILLAAFVSFLALAATGEAQQVTITDNFDTPHDYVADGTGGTLWQGMVGLGEGETVNMLEADMNHPGELYFHSVNGRWQDPWIPLGPYLYMAVKGDFDAQVYVADYAGTEEEWVYHNDCGIMARAQKKGVDLAGPGEDWVAMDYFPIWSCGNFVRQADDNTRAEMCNNGLAFDAHLYSRLEKVGDTFHFYSGTDGTNWTEAECSPITREDLVDMTLQVGLFQATYSDANGYVSFDNFILTRDANPYASSPDPGDGAMGVNPEIGRLLWLSGDYTQSTSGHEVYFSDIEADITGRSATVKSTVTEPNLPLSALQVGTTYYWAVDEVNTANPGSPWEGDVWSFETSGKATDPNPIDGQGNLDPAKLTELVWTPSEYAVTQDLYFGENEATIESSTTPTVSGLAGDANSTAVPQVLEPGVTYYWRIDSHCGALGSAKGDVWEFSTSFPYKLCDDFEEPHDYWMGTDGTIWDGIVGENIFDEINANIDRAGALFIMSGNSWWAGYDQGVLLYKEVLGDWAATIEVVDYEGTDDEWRYNNNCGLMARVGDIDAAGPGEDWIYMAYFPIWSVGNCVYNNDQWRQEIGIEGTAFDGDKHLQLERYGNTFVLSHSPDGETYTYSPVSPITRDDMDGLPVQVGPCHATFSGSSYYVAFDDFCIARNAIKKAYSPKPTSGGELDPMVAVLSWTEGDFAVEHNVYFGTDINDVNDAGPGSPEDRETDEVVDADGGRFSYDAGLYETLVIGQTYYWRIDEVNTSNPESPWKGDVWRYTVQDYSIVDNFESYTGTGKTAASNTPLQGELRKVWKDGNREFSVTGMPKPGTNGSLVQLSTDTYDGDADYLHYQPEDITQTGSNAMKFYYDNDGTVGYEVDLYAHSSFWKYTPVPDPYLSEAYAAVDAAAADDGMESLDMASRDWSSYKLLNLPFYGDPNNDAELMYVGLEDGDGTLVTLSNPDTSRLTETWWHDWFVPLNAFVAKDSELDLTDVAKIYIGFGDKDDPQAGGSGVVFFDNIQLLAYGVCIPGTVVGDFDDDCTVNESDLQLMTDAWLGETPTLPTPLIELDAAGLAYGPLGAGGSWANTGSIENTFFEDFNDIDANDNPVVEDVDGVKCITFDGDALVIADFNTPDALTRNAAGPNDFTVIYKALNPSITDDEEFFTWAKRDGPAGTYAAFGYGSSGAYGAAAHWGGHDLGFDRGLPPAGQWHTIAITYDGVTETVVVDGLVNAIEDKDLIIWPDCMITIGSTYYGDPYVEDITPGIFYSGSLAYVRAYDVAMLPGDLAILTGPSPVDLYPDNKINFKDLAILGNNWLIGPVLLGD